MGTELISGMGEITNYIKQLEEENKKLKNDLRLCADGLIPHGMVGGIVECEREKRQKAEEENKKLKEENKKLKRLGELADFFEKEYHNALQCQADDTEEYEKQIKELKEQLNESDKP